MRQLEDKVAVVAGGSAGIGFVAARRFTEEVFPREELPAQARDCTS